MAEKSVEKPKETPEAARKRREKFWDDTRKKFESYPPYKQQDIAYASEFIARTAQGKLVNLLAHNKKDAFIKILELFENIGVKFEMKTDID